MTDTNGHDTNQPDVTRPDVTRPDTGSRDDATQPAAAPRHGLADFLVDRDVGCPECGFNLRGLTTNRCPECNMRIQLILAQPDALWRMRQWIVAAAAVIALASAASIVAFLSFYGAWGGATLTGRIFAGVVVNVGVLLALSLVLIRYAIRREQPGAQAKLLMSLILAILISSGWSVIANVLWSLF